MTYRVTLDHYLSPAELTELRMRYFPSLLALNDRYTEHIRPKESFPVSPIYVDYLRTSWRLDQQPGRPPTEVATNGLGFAFGLLLSSCTSLRWAIATDDMGPFLTMGRSSDDPVFVSVPPFSYVEKRHETENAEVFRHFFEQTPAEAIGFAKPKNWLLDGAQA